MINDQYTQEDHKSREDDFYALGKYHLTLKALKKAKLHKEGGPLPVLLNVGCGGGLFNELAIEAGFQVVACEPDETAYALAKEFTHPNLMIHLGDISAVQPPVMADAIVCHDVLEHIDAENDALRMIANSIARVPTIIKMANVYTNSRATINTCLLLLFKIHISRFNIPITTINFKPIWVNSS